MTTFSDFEARVRTEYGVIAAWIALHPKLAVLAALLIGGLIGHII